LGSQNLITALQVALQATQKILAAKLKFCYQIILNHIIQNHLIPNPLLRDKKIILNPRGAWKILANFTAERRSREAAKPAPTSWLGLLDKLRTHFQENPDDEF